MNLSLRLMRDLLFLRLKPPQNPARIIVHLIGNVGDIIIAIPAMIALRERYPQSRLILLTSAGSKEKGLAGAKELLDGASFLDHIEDYGTEEIRSLSSARHLLKRVRLMQPDLWVSLPPCNIPFTSIIRNLLFARLTGARFGIGFQLVTMLLFAYEQALQIGIYPNEVTRNLDHLRELGLTDPDVRFELGPITEDETRRIARVAGNARPFVALCPGGKQVGHRWPVERFIEIARSLRAETGLNLITVGSAGEKELCETVLKAAGGGVNMAGELSLRGTANLLAEALFLLTNDTGPMHLAAIKGTPVVAVFGSRELAWRWSPFGDGHELFRAAPVCQQCLFAPQESNHCVSRIPVEEVYEGCLRLLKRLNYRKQNSPDESSDYSLTDEKCASQVELDAALTTIE